MPDREPRSQPITAEEARKLTQAQLPAMLDIAPFLDVVYRAIRESSELGASTVNDPFRGLRMPGPNEEQILLIEGVLRDKGYRVGLRETIPPQLFIEWGEV